MITIAGEERMGTTLGLDHFYFFAGQEVVVEYDVEVRAGSLWIHVYQPFDGTLGGGPTHYITETGSGTWTTPIRDSSYYHITVEPSVVKGPGRGWDLSYSAKWGARWP